MTQEADNQSTQAVQDPDLEIKDGVVRPRDASMKATTGIPSSWDTRNPHVMGKVSMMDNPTHPDILTAIRNILVMGGVAPERIAVYDNHFMIRAAAGKSLMAQRQAIVAFFNSEFAVYGTPAYQARQMLTFINVTPIPGDIVTLFEQKPLDFILKNNLPRLPGEAVIPAAGNPPESDAEKDEPEKEEIDRTV